MSASLTVFGTSNLPAGPSQERCGALPVRALLVAERCRAAVRPSAHVRVFLGAVSFTRHHPYSGCLAATTSKRLSSAWCRREARNHVLIAASPMSAGWSEMHIPAFRTGSRMVGRARRLLFSPVLSFETDVALTLPPFRPSNIRAALEGMRGVAEKLSRSDLHHVLGDLKPSVCAAPFTVPRRETSPEGEN